MTLRPPTPKQWNIPHGYWGGFSGVSLAQFNSIREDWIEALRYRNSPKAKEKTDEKKR